METNVIHTFKLREVSMVDEPANEDANIVNELAKSAALSPNAAYDALMSRAREMATAVNKSATATPMSEAQAFAKLYESSHDPKVRELAALTKSHVMKSRSLTAMNRVRKAAENRAYESLMLMAEASHVSDPSKTAAQHFCEFLKNPEHSELAKAARGHVIFADESDTDDGAVRGADDRDADFDDFDAGGESDVRGRQGATGRGRDGGCSVGTYEVSGTPVMTNSRRATAGPIQGSYNPKARPASATRKINDESVVPAKVKRRIFKYLCAHPEASPEEAARWAVLPKAARKLNRDSARGKWNALAQLQ
jgi:hypothetical protein